MNKIVSVLYWCFTVWIVNGCIVNNSLISIFINKNNAWNEMQMLGIKYNIIKLKQNCFLYLAWSKLEHLIENS